jgi:hypothetical protein
MEQKYIKFCVRSYREKFLKEPMVSSCRFLMNNMKGKHSDWNSENKMSELLEDIGDYYGLKDMESKKKILSVCSVYGLITHHRHQLTMREMMKYNNTIKRYE